MILLGLAGKAGVGKDTVADYLVARYGFTKFSFSDALYREVATAFGVAETELRDRSLKEIESPVLALERCVDDRFISHVLAQSLDVRNITAPLSPRQVLQWWGTEYRRTQDHNYWIAKAEESMYNLWAMYQYPEQRPQYFVNASVRFPNEREWVHKFVNGNVWHLRRDNLAAVHEHSSEVPLDVRQYERELYNNDTIERLYAGVELLLSTQTKFVRVEPMLPLER
jgi:adenylate kinase family enzyme